MSSNNNENNQIDYPKLDLTKLYPGALIHFYGQNDVIKLAMKRNYENCEIESDLATMLVPTKVNNLSTNKLKYELTGKENLNLQFTTFNAQLVTRNNRHLLKAAPRTIPVIRRDRLHASDAKKYTYGKLNVEKLMQTLKNLGLINIKLIEKPFKKTGDISMQIDDIEDIDELTNESNKYLIEINKTNSIDIDINSNQVCVNCENEEIRVKIKDALLKCLNIL